MIDGGKGSTQRPRSIADEEWAQRWDAIFGRDKEQSNQQEKQDDEVVKPDPANL